MKSKIETSKAGSWNGKVFKSERSVMLTIWIVVLAMANCLFMVKAILSDDNFSILIISLILIFVYFLFSISMQMQSDIVICGMGISRRALGVSWQKVRWDNMRVIRAFDSHNRTVKNNKLIVGRIYLL